MKGIKYINITAALLALTLYGCNNNSTTAPVPVNTSASYEITLTNLTASQPIAPVAVILHTSGYSTGILGGVASMALEKLAEGGDNAQLLSEAAAHSAVLALQGGAGLLMPAASEIITTTVSDRANLELSIVGMLVNTNDGFAALHGLNVSNLGLGESQVVMLAVFDAGTEANVETAATLPGQGGVGFDAARNDVNVISIHRGVVTAGDGLSTSALNESHRFDNPAVSIKIRRIS